MPKLNLRDVAERWCKPNCHGCVDIPREYSDSSLKCFDRLLQLQQTIALQEIAGALTKNNDIGTCTRTDDVEDY